LDHSIEEVDLAASSLAVEAVNRFGHSWRSGLGSPADGHFSFENVAFQGGGALCGARAACGGQTESEFETSIGVEEFERQLEGSKGYRCK
jgi:hypothetical protein